MLLNFAPDPLADQISPAPIGAHKQWKTRVLQPTDTIQGATPNSIACLHLACPVIEPHLSTIQLLGVWFPHSGIWTATD